MNRRQIFAVCFFGVLLALLYQMALMFRPFAVLGAPFPMVLMAHPAGSVAVRRYGAYPGTGGWLSSLIRDGGKGVGEALQIYRDEYQLPLAAPPAHS